MITDIVISVDWQTDNKRFRAELSAIPPIVTLSQAFGVAATRHCVDWWNARWLESESNLHIKAVCFIWLQVISLAIDERPYGLIFTWSGRRSVCFWHKPAELARSFLFSSRVYFYLHTPFSCISFKKFSRQLHTFSLCCSGLISAILVLSAVYFFMRVSFSPDIILCGWLGLKHQLTK